MNQLLQFPADGSGRATGSTSADAKAWLDAAAHGRSDEDRALFRASLAVLQTHAASRPEDLGHGIAVADILAGLGMDAQTMAVGLLAPALDMLPDEALEDLPPDVRTLADSARRVGAMADLPAGTSDDQQTERLRKLLLTMVSDVRAVLVLLADRLRIMRCLVTRDADEAAATARHTLAVFAPLASRLGVWQIKWELEDLALRYTEPQAYHSIARHLAERRVDREDFVAQVVERVKHELTSAGILAEVSGRPKHIYSIWRKMQVKSLGFHDIFDVRAVRVITSSVMECYAALGIIHGLWHHVPHEFDDYIASPKSNRYQSLHTAVIGPEGRTVEIQIRTRAMHDHSERGVAAHWRYKENGGSGSGAIDERLAWLRQALEWRAEMDEPDQVLVRLSEEPGDKHVYVLTPKGRVMELPAGATAIDFAYRVHTDVGHRCRGARVDGRLVPLTRPLASGETVEVLMTRSGGPSRDWLNRDLGYLRTRAARARVKQWFRRQAHDDNVAGGRDAWAREIHRLRLPQVDLAHYPARFGFDDLEGLFAAIGRGDLQTGELVSQVQADLAPEALPARRVPSDQRDDAPGAKARVTGAGRLETNLARCCSPQPPADIVGYVTRGKGVSVHERNCANVLRLGANEPDRVLEVQWGGDDTGSYTVDLTITGYDRRGLLSDVTAVIAEAGLDVNAMRTGDGDGPHTVTMAVRLDVPDMPELSRLVTRLLQIRNVFEVSRDA